MNKALAKEIFYEIYPNSFMDSNGDGYGDFDGIISKLDYVKDLGVTAIWLNPHYVSSWKDGGYDVVDYFHADKRFVGDDAFLRLVQAAHAHGLKLILDLVPGHASEDSEIFRQSASAYKTKYDDMFIWTDDLWNAPSKYRFLIGGFDRNGAHMTNYFCTQPAFNYGFYNVTMPEWQMSYLDPRTFSTRDYIIDVCLHYLDMGVDGFRVDMAHSLVKDDPDGIGTIEVWQYIFGKVRVKYPQAIFVSEWVDLDKSLAAGFDMDFMNPFEGTFACDISRYERDKSDNTSFLNPDSTLDITKSFNAIVDKITQNKDKGYISFITSNHDSVRPSYYLNEKALRLFYFVTFTLPGVPFLYYGDEIAMKYQVGLPSKECGFSRTGSRTVMNWDGSKNNGFSTADEKDLFLPIDKTTNVEKMQNDKMSVYYLVRDLIALRKNTTALHGNDIKTIASDDKRLLLYKRNNLTVIINPSYEQKELRGEFSAIIFSDGIVRLERNKLTVGAQSAAIVK